MILSYCLPHPWTFLPFAEVGVGAGRALPHSPPTLPPPSPPHHACRLGSLALVGWSTHTQRGKPRTSQCQVAISQAGHGLCTFPVFLPKNNPRKDDTAYQLLVCLGVLQRAKTSLCFLERRESSSPGSSQEYRAEFTFYHFLFSPLPIPVTDPAGPGGCPLFPGPHTKLCSSLLP